MSFTRQAHADWATDWHGRVVAANHGQTGYIHFGTKRHGLLYQAAQVLMVVRTLGTTGTEVRPIATGATWYGRQCLSKPKQIPSIIEALMETPLVVVTFSKPVCG